MCYRRAIEDNDDINERISAEMYYREDEEYAFERGMQPADFVEELPVADPV